MVWIWASPRELYEFRAEFHGFHPEPLGTKGLPYFTEEPLTTETQAVLKTQYSLKKFRKRHSPPVLGSFAVVDELWRDIILSFVPAERVQFVPARITARGEVCEEFYLMLPFDRVVGIDKYNSEIGSMIENEHGTHIFILNKIVLHPDCLRGLHLARDRQASTILYISDDLKTALSATGQSSSFYTVDEYNYGVLSNDRPVYN
ncbi:hypothetical protein [Aestuariivirga sp.]|uniref:hypothetical protein n=1 Tax=Aestuariivirga sp. TaxID=2650926 RepID=UPI003BAD0164